MLLTCNHNGLGVSTETIFEQPCEQRVAVWNENTAAVQRATPTGQLSCINHTHTQVNCAIPYQQCIYGAQLPFKR